MAQVCLEALDTPLSKKRIIEITSAPTVEAGPGSTVPKTGKSGSDKSGSDKTETNKLDSAGALISASSRIGLASWLTTNP